LSIWVIWILVAVAVICGLLGFVLLPAPRRGFAKVLFYIFLLAAIISYIFYYWAPRSVAPRPLPANTPTQNMPVGR
jgi:uncharacterized membrane protein YtjA (UPF0391 family)